MVSECESHIVIWDTVLPRMRIDVHTVTVGLASPIVNIC
jgi:hypothetical protein